MVPAGSGARQRSENRHISERGRGKTTQVNDIQHFICAISIRTFDDKANLAKQRRARISGFLTRRSACVEELQTLYSSGRRSFASRIPVPLDVSAFIQYWIAEYYL